MSYIAPNTIIKFISNCPLESSYQNTLYFDNISDQTAYFNSIVKTPSSKYTLNTLSYQRSGKGKIRVQLAYEDLVNCNYMMFKNESFENKWFYAFIINVEYVSNIVTEITYTIDVMQTWFFDYTLKQCFVEREHTTTDVVGDNLVPENLEQGDYVSNYQSNLTYNTTNRICFVSSVDENLQDVTTGVTVGNSYTCLAYIIFDDATSANAWLSSVISNNKIDAILAVYMVPGFISASNPVGYTAVSMRKRTPYSSYSAFRTLDGYTPKNNKLFTYPYNLLHISTDSAQADFKYEYFKASTTNDVAFNIYHTVIPTPTLSLIPLYYQCDNNVLVQTQFQQRVTLTDYPQCAITADVYKVYLAQNMAQLPVKMAYQTYDVIKGAVKGATSGTITGALEGAGVGAVGGAVLGGVLGAIDASEGIATTLAQLHDISTKPPQVNGTQTSISDFSIGVKNIIADQLTIRAEFARKIDSYFDMFGYAVKEVKVPNRNVRPYWTYTKTIGCLIDGEMPADDEDKIQRIYDKGIRFWKDPTHFGNYSLDNSPT